MTKPLDILIVDDRPENLLTLEHLLESPDLNIVRAASGQEALQLMLDHDFALVLLDVQMPDMDGFEAAELMRGNRRTRHIPIIFVTANHKEHQHIFRGYDSGAVDYLFKPLEPQMLLGKVRIFLEIHRQRLDLQAKTRELDATIGELRLLQAELEEKNRQLQLLSSQDGLTGIPNRRQFDEMLTQEWNRMAREKQPISLIILDVDHFKRYNDLYGHLAGDSCLRRVAEALAGMSRRPGDMVARFGGEEFAAILPGTNIDGACIVAENMRRTVADLAIEHQASPVQPVVTVSLGISAVMALPGCTPADLLQAADQGLYRAKQQGRNRWVVSTCVPAACDPGWSA